MVTSCSIGALPFEACGVPFFGAGWRLASAVGTGSLATDSLATDSLATDSLATGSLATGSLATDSLATDSLATDSLATDSLATDSAAFGRDSKAGSKSQSLGHNPKTCRSSLAMR